MAPIVFLFTFAVLIFLGLIGYLLSHRWNIPHSIVLILIGAIIARPGVSYGILIIPEQFLDVLVRFTLILVVFDIFSRYDHTTPTTMHSNVRSYKLIAILIGLPSLAALSYFILGLESFAYSLLFAAVILPSSRVFVKRFRPARKSVAQFLEIESIKVTAYALFISAIMLFIMGWEGPGLAVGLFFGLAIGAGTGLISGLLLARPLRHEMLSKVRHFGLIAVALVTYSLSEAMGGIGIVSIMSLAFFFGSLKTSRLPFLYEFSSDVAEFSEISMFILLGILIPLPISPGVYIISFLILIAVFLTRFAIFQISFGGSRKERLFLSLLAPKDISSAVITLLLITAYGIDSTSSVPQVLFLIICFSAIVSWVASLQEKESYGTFSGMPKSEL